MPEMGLSAQVPSAGVNKVSPISLQRVFQNVGERGRAPFGMGDPLRGSGTPASRTGGAPLLALARVPGTTPAPQVLS